VCVTSKQTSETVCLTSYKSPRGSSDLLNSVKIWEACRATSAASSFFDPIAVGQYKEEFVDGGTGANNPVWEVWNQAQLMWGPEPIEGRIKCLVSIGTGVPSLKQFQDDVFHIGETLVAIATETEQTAERFQRDKSHLDNRGWDPGWEARWRCVACICQITSYRDSRRDVPVRVSSSFHEHRCVGERGAACRYLGLRKAGALLVLSVLRWGDPMALPF
jgi:hypothetical protein